MPSKITLISPYNNIISYGLRSLSTYLRNKGVNVTVLYLIHYFNIPYRQDVLNQVIDLCRESDLVGISLMSNYFSNCVQLTDAIKSGTDVPVVWGGVHPTVAPDECLDHCDYVVSGEGEETILELARAVHDKRSIDGIRNIVMMRGDSMVCSNVRPFIDRENLPVIDNDFSSDYILHKDNVRRLSSKLLKYYMTSDYMTLSSLGCPFSCSYCINNKVKKLYSNKVRFRLVEDIMKELINVKNTMPFVQHIWFEDDLFIMRPIEEMREFASEYREKINLPFFVSGLNPVYVTEDKLEMLISAGMDRVKMGIQTGAQNTKKLFKRTISNERVIEAAWKIVKFRKRLKLTSYDLIVDNPFETNDDVVKTIKLLHQLPSPFTLNLYALTFYPGTDIYDKAVADGLVKDNVTDVYNKHYLKINNTYLNFIIVLFTVFKIPGVFFRFLLKKQYVEKNRMVPALLFQFVQFLGHARRGLNLLMKGDRHSFLRNIRIKVYK